MISSTRDRSGELNCRERRFSEIFLCFNPAQELMRDFAPKFEPSGLCVVYRLPCKVALCTEPRHSRTKK